MIDDFETSVLSFDGSAIIEHINKSMGGRQMGCFPRLGA